MLESSPTFTGKLVLQSNIQTKCKEELQKLMKVGCDPEGVDGRDICLRRKTCGPTDWQCLVLNRANCVQHTKDTFDFHLELHSGDQKWLSLSQPFASRIFRQIIWM